MIRLEITGDTLTEFHADVVKTLAAFCGMRAKPAEQQPPAQPEPVAPPPEPVKEPTEIFPPSEDVSAAETQPEPEKPKRGRKPKAQPEPDPEATKTYSEELAKTEPEPAISVDDIRDRVRQVINSCKASLPEDEKQPDAKAVEHTSKLFAKFDIKKVSDLPADRYAEFMTESEKWLNGKQG